MKEKLCTGFTMVYHYSVYYIKHHTQLSFDILFHIEYVEGKVHRTVWNVKTKSMSKDETEIEEHIRLKNKSFSK